MTWLETDRAFRAALGEVEHTRKAFCPVDLRLKQRLEALPWGTLNEGGRTRYYEGDEEWRSRRDAYAAAVSRADRLAHALIRQFDVQELPT